MRNQGDVVAQGKRMRRCRRSALLATGLIGSASGSSVCNVPQEDVLLAGLSPVEMLSYAAELRLVGLTAAQRQRRVLDVLKSLHLTTEEMAQRIGSVEERGLSGGSASVSPSAWSFSSSHALFWSTSRRVASTRRWRMMW